MPGYLRGCFVSVGGNRGQEEARFHLTPPEILPPGLLIRLQPGGKKLKRKRRGSLGGGKRGRLVRILLESDEGVFC